LQDLFSLCFQWPTVDSDSFRPKTPQSVFGDGN